MARIIGQKLIEVLKPVLGIEGRPITRIVIDAHYNSPIYVYVAFEGEDNLLRFRWEDFVGGENIIIAPQADRSNS